VDFDKVAEKLKHAKDWYARVREIGESFDPRSSESEWLVDPYPYQSAVVWTNILFDNAFTSEGAQKFVKLIDERVQNPDFKKLIAAYTFLKTEIHKTSSSRISISPLGNTLDRKSLKSSKDWCLLASLIKVDGHPDALKKIRTEPKNSLRNIVQKKELFWLTPYKKIYSIFKKKLTVEDALAKVGLDFINPSNNHKICLLLVEPSRIWDNLYIPTVADSDFYVLWGPKPENTITGMTRDTRTGKCCLPEIVIEAKNIEPLIDRDEAWLVGGGISESEKSEQFNKRWLDKKGVPIIKSSGELLISQEHILYRWNNEIKKSIKRPD